MKFTVLTLFPELFEHIEDYSILGRAIKDDRIQLETVNIRDFSENKHKKVDDYPFGGGPGMLMTPQPLADAIEASRSEKSYTVYLSPRGTMLTQKKLEKLSQKEHLVLVNGHYEGIDERIIEHYIDEEISIGDYILSGGEFGSLVIIDGVSRLVDGVLSNEDSSKSESHSDYLLEYSQYTRPRNFRGFEVPEVLLSGDHKAIEEFKRKDALKQTLIKRPDLLERADLTDKDLNYLRELKQSHKEA